MKTEATGRGGRPRSEQAREAVLHAVDDLLVEVGYAAMTMKGIAERAGVGRQTVYRWWSNKAEILLEASADDAREELAVEPTGDAAGDLATYLQRVVRFLTLSTAGAAYRALVGEAQHDTEVAKLLAGQDVLIAGARAVLQAADATVDQALLDSSLDEAATRLVGPVFFWILSGHDPAALDPSELARTYLSTPVG